MLSEGPYNQTLLSISGTDYPLPGKAGGHAENSGGGDRESGTRSSGGALVWRLRRFRECTILVEAIINQSYSGVGDRTVPAIHRKAQPRSQD